MGEAHPHAASTSSALELTVSQAWFLSDLLKAGEFPWALAISPPLELSFEREKVSHTLREELTAFGVLDPQGNCDKRVARWMRTVCGVARNKEPGSCWEARTIRAGIAVVPGNIHQLLSVVAIHEDCTIAVMRAGALLTLTELPDAHSRTLTNVFTAGLPGTRPAKFRQFALPTRDGAKADDQIRRGASATAVVANLDVAEESREVLQKILAGQRSYVEITANSGDERAEKIGIGVLDTAVGRVLVAPSRASDGQWVSTFSPGTAAAIATSLSRLVDSIQGAPV